MKRSSASKTTRPPATGAALPASEPPKISTAPPGAAAAAPPGPETSGAQPDGATRRGGRPTRRLLSTEAEKRFRTFRLVCPTATQVCLAGTFNDWSPTSIPLERNVEGIWEVNLTLLPGSYEYRFVVDGNWIEDPEALWCLPNPFGERNSVARIA